MQHIQPAYWSYQSLPVSHRLKDTIVEDEWRCAAHFSMGSSPDPFVKRIHLASELWVWLRQAFSCNANAAFCCCWVRKAKARPSHQLWVFFRVKSISACSSQCAVCRHRWRPLAARPYTPTNIDRFLPQSWETGICMSAIWHRTWLQT